MIQVLFFLFKYLIKTQSLNCFINSIKSILDSVIVKNLWSGHWLLEDVNFSKQIITEGVEADTITNSLKDGGYDNKTSEKMLQMAISSFLTFCERNWNPHPDEFNLEKHLGIEWPKSLDVSILLQRDSEPMYANILYPELLYLSSQIFSALSSFEPSLVSTRLLKFTICLKYRY